MIGSTIQSAARCLVLALITLVPAQARAQDTSTPAQQPPMAPELVTALQPEHAWLNTDRPLRLAEELRGHVVLLDFWTYCCINCMHVLPDLEYLEHKYADQPFVVVGVHSAKFEAEGDRASIRNAIFRYNIRHPVLIDTGMALWKRYGIRAWPSFVLIGSDGRLIGVTSGEGKRDVLDRAIDMALDLGRERGTLAPRRFEITLDHAPRAATGLSYPGKVLAVPPTAAGQAGMIFIADSSHHRVIATHWPDADGRCSVFAIYGSGERALADAWATQSAFHDPQGMAFDPALGARGTLYVADTKNHAIRSIDLASGRVSTIAGNGVQGYDRAGGARGREQPLASPWDLALSPDANTLYVAMAGTHQLWKVDLRDGARATAVAGGLGENLVDGPASQAMLAQPSGLALSADAKRLYFADSESSAVRFLDLASNQVATIIGTGLFDFGDIDGTYPEARLQHCLGLTVYPTDAGERLLVADTYNDTIKLVHPFARASQRLLGVPRHQQADTGVMRLAEPGGLSLVPADATSGRAVTLFIADTNNHRIVMADPATGVWREIILDGLLPPGVVTPNAAGPDPAMGAVPATLALTPDHPAVLTLDVRLPPGASVNAEAPLSIRVWRLPRDAERMPPCVIVQSTGPGMLPARVEIPAAEVRPGALWVVELSFAWCEHGSDATCRPGQIAWRVDLSAGTTSSGTLEATQD